MNRSLPARTAACAPARKAAHASLPGRPALRCAPVAILLPLGALLAPAALWAQDHSDHSPAGDLADLRARLAALEERMGADGVGATASEAPRGHHVAPGVLDSLSWEAYLYTEYFWFNDPAKKSNFDNHYVHLGFSGAWTPEARFHATVEWEHADQEVFVEEGYVDLDYFSGRSIFRVGRVIVPFNRFDDYHDNIANHFVSRPQPASEILGSAWKDAGAIWLGSWPVADAFGLDWAGYVVNGRGQGDTLRKTRLSTDNNDSKLVGGRLGALVADQFQLGVSANQSEYDDRDRLRLAMWGADARWDAEDFSLYGEYLAARAEAPRPSDPYHESWGAFGWATYTWKNLIGEHDFRTGVRFDTYTNNGQNFRPYNPSTTAPAAAGAKLNGFTVGPDVHLRRKETHQWVFDLTWLPHPQVAVKFDYRVVLEGAHARSKSNNVFEIQVGGRF